jgi:hypothetical protein
MTDATSPANGHAPGSEPARREIADPYGTSGYGAAAEGEIPAAPDSGGTTASPSWPGVVRPAGWFLSATGEAAPPARPGPEPARTDADSQSATQQPQSDEWLPIQSPIAGWMGHSSGPDDLEPDEPADYQPDDYDQSDYWYEDPQPTSVHQVQQPWSWRPGAQSEPREPGAWHGAPQSGPPEAAPRGPVVGPTAALRGRPGGPGFVVPPGAVPGLYEPARRSGWQLAHDVWQDAGITWAPPAIDPQPAPGWSEYPGSGLPGQSWPADGRSQAALPPPPGFAAPPSPGFPALPLGAPTLADAPASAHSETWTRRETPGRVGPAPPRSRLAEQAEPDELFRAWQGSVRQAAARPRAAGRRRQAWQVARVGIPAAVIVTVGAGAVMMLTGKTNEMLADRANQGNPSSGTGGAAVGGASAALAASAFPGYPGQRGTVLVSAIASAGGTRLAVGSADGHPAIWRRAANGTWSLVSASSPAVYQRPGVENLTSVAFGPAGWIAVGDVVSGAAQQPVVVTSADGVTWQALGNMAAFAGPGTYVMGVGASRHGYVVVGRQASGGRMFAAMWWSADLRTWVPGDNGGLDGRLRSSTAYAVAATATGYIAGGSHGTCHTIWTSADGRHWSVYDVPVPAGASGAVLRLVAVNGARAVAAGYAVTKAGDLPIVVVSADGGRHWRQIVLAAPAGLGAVTALTAAGGGFVAAGQAGPAGAQRAVIWSSADGLTWSAATPAARGVRQITALAAAGGTVTGTVTGTAQQGAVPSVVTIPAP